MSAINFFIISGTSGSGKTIALQVLEDLGFYCIDNLPAILMPDFASQILARQDINQDNINQCAISIDSRNRHFIAQLKQHFDSLSSLKIDYKVIFLDADDKSLLKRFSETRRKHPLSNAHTSLVEAIAKERTLLKPIFDLAHKHIDSSNKTPHELRSIIRNTVTTSNQHSLMLLFQSFGFKYGNPTDADFVFDVRCLPNPHWDAELKPMTGLDQPVADFLSEQPLCNDMYQHIESFITFWLPKFIDDNRNYITVSIGCTGGRHRSVYLSHRLNHHFSQDATIQTQLRHRELNL